MRFPICPGQNQPQGVALRPQGSSASPRLIKEMVRKRRSKWVTDPWLAALTNSQLQIFDSPLLYAPPSLRVAHYFIFHLMLGGLVWFNRLTVLATATTDTSPFWGKLIPPTVIYFQQKWHTKKNMLTSYHSTSGSILDLKKRFQKMIWYSILTLS